MVVGRVETPRRDSASSVIQKQDSTSLHSTSCLNKQIPYYHQISTFLACKFNVEYVESGEEVLPEKGQTSGSLGPYHTARPRAAGVLYANILSRHTSEQLFSKVSRPR